MKLTSYERETIINYNMAETDASIYTYDKKLIARLEKLAAKYPEEFRLKDRSLHGDATYIFPKSTSPFGNHTTRNGVRQRENGP